jgi:hypothetical protein
VTRTKLLVRDLAQVATPAGRDAPLRGRALREVDVVEDAFVLCADGRIEAFYADTGKVAQVSVADDHVYGEGVVYFTLPFRHWYDDLIFT